MRKSSNAFCGNGFLYMYIMICFQWEEMLAVQMKIFVPFFCAMISMYHICSVYFINHGGEELAESDGSMPWR
jgi:hypothetical protein